MNTKTTIATAAVASFLALAAGAEARELRFASIVPDNSIWAQQAQGFAERVAEISNGELTVSYFGNAEMGTMADTLRMVMSGRLDIWMGATPALGAVVPEISLLTLPYLFDSEAQIACSMPQMVEPTRTLIDERFHLLAFTAVGSQGIGSQQEIRLPADAANLKIRTAPLQSTMEFIGGVGANPVPLAAAESLAALSTGLVDAVDLSSIYYVATGANRSAPYFTPTAHNYNFGGVIVAARTWGSLSSDEQAILAQAWDETSTFAQSVEGVAAFEAQMMALHTQSGGTLVELSDDERAAWQTAGRAVWDNVLAEMRGDVEGYLGAIEAAKSTCGE